MKVKKKMTKEKAEQIYKQIALKNGVTVDEVKTQIKLAKWLLECAIKAQKCKLSGQRFLTMAMCPHRKNC